jgi:hypothetical protein
MKDLHSIVAVDQLIPAATHEADNTPTAADLLGFESAEIVIAVGVGGITFTTSNKVEFKLTHSDDGANYEAVTVDDMLGLDSVGTGGIIHSLIAAHAAATVTKVGYRGGKRYLKLLADFTGTHAAGTPMAAILVKGDPGRAVA